MQSPAHVQLETVGASDLARDSDWWTIYEHSFPANEREPAGVILESLRIGAGLAFRARRGDVSVAIATTHLLLHPPAVFLVYLAVASGHRGSGIGGRLFEYAWSASARELTSRGCHALGLIWEVDPAVARLPYDAGQAHVTDQANSSDKAQRRIRFFEKCGGILLDREYRQPPVNGTDSVPMRLMFRPAAGGTTPDAPPVTELVRAIYFEKYAAVNRIPTETLDRLLR